MYCELSSCSEAFDFKNGVKYIFSNQFVSSGLQETFIMPDELYEAILCLYFPVVFFFNFILKPLLLQLFWRMLQYSRENGILWV